MIHDEILAAIDEILAEIQENDVFKIRFRKLIENALTKTQERSFRDDDLRELLELCMEEEDLFSEREGATGQYAG